MPAAEKLIRRLRPALIRDFAPPPVKVADDLWVLDRRLRMPGGPVLPTRSTIVGLADGELLVVSPPAVEAGGLEALDLLGTVRHVVVPNAFHYLNAPGFLARYDEATFWAAPGLFSRIPSLPDGESLGDHAPDEWEGALEIATLRPTNDVSEVVFFHAKSETLVVTDVAFHMVRFAGVFDRIAWRASGVPPGFGPSRTARMLLLHDRERSRAFLEKVVAWPFRRVIVAHGDILDTNAHAQFRRAFLRWLR
jgi:hypothetical protein